MFTDCPLFYLSSRGNAYHYNEATIFAQQATTPYLDAGQQPQNFTAATAPGAVSSGQTYLQVTPAGASMQAQRHPITHTTRASPATVSFFGPSTYNSSSKPCELYNHANKSVSFGCFGLSPLQLLQ